MPTATYGTAKTVRAEFEKAALDDRVGGLSYGRPVSGLGFRGRTDTVTITELFINGKGTVTGVTDSAKRMYIGENSGHAFNVRWAAFDVVAKTIVSAGQGFVAVQRVGAAAPALSATATGVAIANQITGTNPTLNYSVGNAAAAQIILDVDASNFTLRVRVTAPVATQVEWMVELLPVFNITDRAQMIFGDRAGGDSVEL